MRRLRGACQRPLALLTLIAGATLGACGGPADGDYRAAFAGQCEAQLRAKPALPAGLDVRGACACGVDAAFANRTGVAAYAASQEGQQAFAQALAQCLQQRAAAVVRPPAPAAPPAREPAGPPPPDAPEAVDEDAEGEVEPAE